MTIKFLCLIFVTAFLICDSEAVYSYKTLFLKTPLDHFSFSNNVTFDLRYLVNDTFWNAGGPIFFYTGNEGDIDLFAQNTGFMWDIAPEFGAMIVFAEHRFYGKSLPFGNKSYADVTRLGYLTSTQALADYVYLLDYVQGSRMGTRKKRCPVIAFGGSYGGMLSAWMRLKYPHAVDGAVASSAPIYQFQGLTDCSTFNNIVAKVFKVSSAKGECARNIKKSWEAIRKITSSPEGKAWLTNEWKLCAPLTGPSDVAELSDILTEIYGNIAMINYPYPTNFLSPVPAYPVRTLCSKIDQPNLDGKPLLTALGEAIGVYINYTGSTKCFSVNASSNTIGELGWDFQACTELTMPMCTAEGNEMFEVKSWDFKKYQDDCYKQFGIRVPRDDYAILEYGGKNAVYSNVIFTNGLLDPWTPGGVMENKTQSVYVILIKDAAHHLDLRGANPRDPVSVVNTRVYIRHILHAWIKLVHKFL